jgi:hypothetical protein
MRGEMARGLVLEDELVSRSGRQACGPLRAKAKAKPGSQ